MMQEGNQKHRNALGVYVHVPFCSSTCDFCAFYQERPSKKKIESYFISLEKEMQQVELSRAVDTVFIGGGTPGLLKPDELARLCSLINELGLKESPEWTIELAPNEVTPEKLSTLKEYGTNRISLGVQTFDPELMNELGRKHGPEKVYHAYDMIREKDFASVNLDLIFGMPGQSMQMWEADMKEAVKLKPNHLSTYCLTFEEDTALYYRLAKGDLSIDPEKEATFYELAWEFLPSNGYKQYEISNFAMDGFASIHNLNTWRMNEWIGFGPSACSQFKNKRWKNPSNLEKWSAGVENGFSRNDYEDFSNLSSHTLAEDAILFGLRMNEGINLDQIFDSFGVPAGEFKEVRLFFEKIVAENLAKETDGWITLTLAGRIRADAIAEHLPSARPA